VNAALITGLSYPSGIVVVVPEPATGLLVMAGVLGLAVARRPRASACSSVCSEGRTYLRR
jgi:hypothetical protein